MREQARLRGRQHELDRLRVDHLHLHTLTRHQHVVLRLRDHVRVQGEVVVPELHVLGGERRPVGPLVSLAQEEGELGEVLVPLPVLRHVRHDGLEVVGHAHQIHVTHRQEVRRAGLGRVRQDVQRPSVAADLPVRSGHQRLFRQPLGERWQGRVPGDAPVQLGDGRILLEGELAAGQRFELRELVLLWVLPRRHFHHVGDGEGRAVARQGMTGQQQQAGTHTRQMLVHGVTPSCFGMSAHRLPDGKCSRR